MEWNDNVLDMWNLMAFTMTSNAIFFASCAFLIWVGFRFSGNIYNTPSTPIFAKILATTFCGSVALMTYGTMVQAGQVRNNVAEVFSAMADTGVNIGPAAEQLVELSGGPAVNIVQIVFVASAILVQLAQIWMKKS